MKDNNISEINFSKFRLDPCSVFPCLWRARKGFFDISGCKIPTDGQVPHMDGVLLNAKWYSDAEVAELVEYYELLERAEISLRDFIDLRRSRTRKAREKPKQFQKQEVVK